MAKTTKTRNSRSTATIDLGTERKERIATYRAKKHLEGTRISSVEAAVCALVDRALEVERV